MLRAQRIQYILQRLQTTGTVSIQELSESLGVSYMTIWRDLGVLEDEGHARRVRGGAVWIPPSAEEYPPVFPEFDSRFDPQYEKKQIIAQYAAKALIEDGDFITVEAGTTTSSLIPYLQQKNLTILTNGLVTSWKAANLLDRSTVMCSGGILIETGAFIGPQAESFFSGVRVNKVFFSAKGVTANDGFTDPTPLYSQLKQVMKTSAEQTIMLMDSSKLGVRSLVRVMALEQVDILVTDAAAPEPLIAELRQKGLEVHIAHPI